MRHLKILKPRIQNEAVEVDLRGFGEEPLFKHQMPQSVLSIHKGPQHDSFLEDCHKLHVLGHPSTKHSGWSHHTTHGSPTMNYKVQAVHLFSLALKALNQPQGEKGLWRIWETSPLKTLLKESLEHPPVLAPLPIDDFFDPDGGSSHPLWLAPSTALHLKQAGFEIGDATDKGLGLHIENCRALYKKELEKLSALKATQQLRKKAGGR